MKGNDDLIDKLLMLVRGEGLSIAAAARSLGVGVRSAQEFFSGDKKWAEAWWERNEEDVDAYFAGFGGKSVGDMIQELKDDPLADIFKGTWLEIKDDSIRPSDISGMFTFGYTPKKKPLKILVIADTQCKPDEALDYMSWIGQYIYDKKPDVVVHIGDHYDFPSLSSYDKGKKSFEGRRLKADIEAGNLGMKYLTREFLRDGYSPRMVFCMGNHEDRFDRLKNDIPELDGFVGTDLLPLVEMGWEVYPFLKPVDIEGIFFVHYLANPMTGKPYAGTALNQLKTVGKSFVVGHKQVLDIAIRNTLDGKQQIGIINGACYPFDESYKGFQGNSHFRGITMLHEVNDGAALPMFVSLDYLKERYESKL